MKLTEKLRQARGSEYIELSDKLYSLISQNLLHDAQKMRERKGKFIPLDIGILCIKYDISFKLCCRFLKDLNFINYSSYIKVTEDRNFKVKELLKEAHQVIQEQWLEVYLITV